jgi:cystathionine beta-lyase
LLTPSGLASIAVVDFAFLNAGDHVLIPDNVYGPNRESRTGCCRARDHDELLRSR